MKENTGRQGMKNFRVRAYPSDLRNNISFDAKVGGDAQMYDLAAGTTEKNNSWNSINGQYALVPYKTATGGTFDQKTIYNQFVSTSKEDFLAPREADGSLPKNGFGRLKPNSIFIDKGTNVVRGMNPATLKSFDITLSGFYGTAVDLGAYEYIPSTGLPTIQSTAKNLKAYPNPFLFATTFDIEAFESGAAQLVISDLSGKIISVINISGLMKAEKRSFRFDRQLKAGVYTVELINGNYRQTLKLIKFN